MIDSNSSDCKDKTVKNLPFTNLNTAIGYLTPNAKLTFTQLTKMFTKALIL